MPGGRRRERAKRGRDGERNISSGVFLALLCVRENGRKYQVRFIPPFARPGHQSKPVSLSLLPLLFPFPFSLSSVWIEEGSFWCCHLASVRSVQTLPSSPPPFRLREQSQNLFFSSFFSSSQKRAAGVMATKKGGGRREEEWGQFAE